MVGQRMRDGMKSYGMDGSGGLTTAWDNMQSTVRPSPVIVSHFIPSILLCFSLFSSSVAEQIITPIGQTCRDIRPAAMYQDPVVGK